MKRISFLITVVVVMIGAVVAFGMLQQTASANSKTAEATNWGDEFNGTTLMSSWSWVREDSANWSLTAKPGYLHIVTQPGSLLTSANNNKNVLLRHAPPGNYAISTQVQFRPTAEYQSAGLLVYQDDDNYLWVGREYDSEIGNAIYFVQEQAGAVIGKNYAVVVPEEGKAFLKIERTNKRYVGFYSADGTHWLKLGKHVVGDSFSPKVGLLAGNGDKGAPATNANFNFFHIVSLQ